MKGFGIGFGPDTEPPERDSEVVERAIVAIREVGLPEEVQRWLEERVMGRKPSEPKPCWDLRSKMTLEEEDRAKAWEKKYRDTRQFLDSATAEIARLRSALREIVEAGKPMEDWIFYGNGAMKERFLQALSRADAALKGEE